MYYYFIIFNTRTVAGVHGRFCDSLAEAERYAEGVIAGMQIASKRMYSIAITDRNFSLLTTKQVTAASAKVLNAHLALAKH